MPRSALATLTNRFRQSVYSATASGQHRLDEAELAQASGEGLELRLADPAGVGGVGTERLDCGSTAGHARCSDCRVGW